MADSKKPGLWANIHAKRERIKRGSGEHMRRPGEKGRPTAANFRSASEELLQLEREFKTPETAETQSTDPNKPHSRFDGTKQAADTYKKQTPGQTVKRVVKEALYHGKQVPLGKPMKGDVKKSKVYVKDPKSGNVKKVNFGDPNMTIKKDIPARRKSFRARHHCDTNPGPRTKARYWSCRAW
jgi:hypothetical protein